MDEGDLRGLRPDAFQVCAEAEAGRADGQVESVGEDDAGQVGFVFGADEGDDEQERAEGEHGQFGRPQAAVQVDFVEGARLEG